MEIYFINICIEWLFKLYEEYLVNIKNIIAEYLNIKVHIHIIPDDDNYLNEFNNIYKNDKNKYIFCGNIGSVNNIYDLYKNKNFYYLNIEQMSHPSYYRLFRDLNKNIKIIDYSEENILFHKVIYNKTFLLPPYYNTYKNNINKSIDIISFSNNEYRKNILNSIDPKFKIKYLDNIFGEERDEFFINSKIYINLHCSDQHKTMELIRIINLLKKKVIVISQSSISIDSLYIKDSIITFANIEQLNYLLNDIINNYDLYYKKIFTDNNINFYNNYVIKNIISISEDKD